jgi:hypothetical protein
MGQLFTRCQGVTGYAELVDCWMGPVSALWRWRGRPDQLAAAVRRDRWTLGEGNKRVVRADGFSEGPPVSIKRIEAQIPEGLGREAASISLGRGVVDEYGRLVDVLREHGTTVVATLIPYSPPYAAALEERHPGFDAERLAAARQLSVAIDVPIADPGPFGPWWGDGSSQNIKHLSREGAVDFTRQLWDTPAFREALLAGLPKGVSGDLHTAP